MRADYLRNLEIFAECSRRTGKPFYNFMLTIGHLFYRTVRAYEDIAWQVYTSLAYGCTGMQTFTYWTLLSNGEAENITSSLVLRDGGKTQAWYSMRQVISEVRAFEKEFLKYRWCGAMVAGGPDANFGQLQHSCRASRDRGTESGRPLRRRHFRKRRNVRAVDRELHRPDRKTERAGFGKDERRRDNGVLPRKTAKVLLRRFLWNWKAARARSCCSNICLIRRTIYEKNLENARAGARAVYVPAYGGVQKGR